MITWMYQWIIMCEVQCRNVARILLSESCKLGEKIITVT